MGKDRRPGAAGNGVTSGAARDAHGRTGRENGVKFTGKAPPGGHGREAAGPRSLARDVTNHRAARRFKERAPR